jgi:hypothetical protein
MKIEHQKYGRAIPGQKYVKNFFQVPYAKKLNSMV